jgi:hypothetical protein
MSPNVVPSDKEITKKSTAARSSGVFKVKFKKDDFLSKKTQGKNYFVLVNNIIEHFNLWKIFNLSNLTYSYIYYIFICNIHDLCFLSLFYISILLNWNCTFFIEK